jgi:hypothetical protein
MMLIFSLYVVVFRDVVEFKFQQLTTNWLIDPSGKCVTLAIEPCFHDRDTWI